jgi:hypothetical protein
VSSDVAPCLLASFRFLSLDGELCEYLTENKTISELLEELRCMWLDAVLSSGARRVGGFDLLPASRGYVAVWSISGGSDWFDDEAARDELRAAAIAGGLESMLLAYRSGVPLDDLIPY